MDWSTISAISGNVVNATCYKLTRSLGKLINRISLSDIWRLTGISISSLDFFSLSCLHYILPWQLVTFLKKKKKKKKSWLHLLFIFWHTSSGDLFLSALLKKKLWAWYQIKLWSEHAPRRRTIHKTILTILHIPTVQKSLGYFLSLLGHLFHDWVVFVLPRRWVSGWVNLTNCWNNTTLRHNNPAVELHRARACASLYISLYFSSWKCYLCWILIVHVFVGGRKIAKYGQICS